jgi:hypothetical protein
LVDVWRRRRITSRSSCKRKRRLRGVSMPRSRRRCAVPRPWRVPRYIVIIVGKCGRRWAEHKPVSDRVNRNLPARTGGKAKQELRSSRFAGCAAASIAAPPSAPRAPRLHRRPRERRRITARRTSAKRPVAAGGTRRSRKVACFKIQLVMRFLYAVAAPRRQGDGGERSVLP